MSNISGRELDGADEYFRAAPDVNFLMTQSLRDDINRLRNNDPILGRVFINDPGVVDALTDLAWEMLGGYIADNEHLKEMNVSDVDLRDEEMALLFKKMTRSVSLKVLDLSDNSFGSIGVQSIVPFLKNARCLACLKLHRNRNVNTECFSLLASALHDGAIEDLHLGGCSIDDISALERYTLPRLRYLRLNNNNIRIIPSLEKHSNLEKLWLAGNDIGKGGCRSAADLLQNKGNSLRFLDLESNNIGNEEAEMLASSLKHNTALEFLFLEGNQIGKRGCVAFFKLLNDVSTIESTYNSNHTLKILRLTNDTDLESAEIKNHIDCIIGHIIDAYDENPKEAGRRKVIATQMNNSARMEISRLQGIDCSYSSLFANIEISLLPNILALTGSNHGQSELYRMLVATAPDVTSLIDKTSMLKGAIAKTTTRIASLAAEYRTLSALNCDMKKRLDSMESGWKSHSVAAFDDNISAREKKRLRSASF